MGFEVILHCFRGIVCLYGEKTVGNKKRNQGYAPLRVLKLVWKNVLFPKGEIS